MVNIARYNVAQLERIERAKQEEDWFTAVVLSATQLELHGCLKIKDYFSKLKANPGLVDSILEKIYLKDVADYLLLLDMIDEREKSMIMKINTFRVHFVHRMKKEKLKHGKEAKAEYEPAVNEAIRILKEKLDVIHLLVGPGR